MTYGPKDNGLKTDVLLSIPCLSYWEQKTMLRVAEPHKWIGYYRPQWDISTIRIVLFN
jgi:hypothetical protein